MTLYRATVLDTPGDPFHGDPLAALAVESDAGLVVNDGIVSARGPYLDIRAAYPDETVEHLEGGVLLPGFVDAHVHYPQVRAIGGLGMPLLDWLEQCALPEESRFADDVYAASVAEEFLRGLVSCGTTTALVFGAHFASAMEIFFTHAERSGLNITAGLVLGDRLLRPDLHCTVDSALTDSTTLIKRWHGRGRLRYAVTPRFSLATSEGLLEACNELLRATPDTVFTTHVNENQAEVATVAGLFPDIGDYVGSYDAFGLVTDRSVFAHNVHATDAELRVLGEARAWTAHCPTSNSALGSGLFPLARHIANGVGVALGSDVGAGTGFYLGKEALQAYFMQQLLGPQGFALTPVHLLYLATRAGARALGLGERTGDLGVGKDFDAVWFRPDAGSTLAVNLARAADPVDALARIFALATPADIAVVWAGGRVVSPSTPSIDG